MKNLFRNFIFASVLGIIFSHPCALYAENIRLSWSGLEIDENVVLQFANLNANEIVQRIRTLGAKVLILDTSNDQSPEQEELTIGNLPGDEEAVRFYTRYFMEEQERGRRQYGSNTITLKGLYLKPNFHHHNTASYNDFTERPFVNIPCLLLLGNVSRHVIIHEYMHFYLDSLLMGFPPSFVERDQRLHHQRCRELIEGLRLQQRKNEILHSLSQGRFDLLKQQDRRTIEEKSTVVINFFIEFLKNEAHRTTAEEIDIYRLLSELGERLNLTREGMISDVRTITRYLNTLSDNVEQVLRNPNIENIRGVIGRFSPPFRVKFSELENEANSIIAKMNEFRNWALQQEKRLNNR